MKITPFRINISGRLQGPCTVTFRLVIKRHFESPFEPYQFDNALRVSSEKTGRCGCPKSERLE